MGIARGRNPHGDLYPRRRQGKRGGKNRFYRWRRRRSAERRAEGRKRGKKRRETESERGETGSAIEGTKEDGSCIGRRVGCAADTPATTARGKARESIAGGATERRPAGG